MEMSSQSTGANRELPAVDERLVAPESGYEIDDGKLIRVTPCHEPHGDRHSKLAALLEAHVASEFNVALDMLTRTSETTDIAPDASVYARARDPKTGGRQLEQLAFEIVSTESLSHAGRKAAQLASRGVRRVFAIDVERSRLMEWSRDLGTWSMLDSDSQIVDPVFAVALPIREVVSVAAADDAVARALLAKRNRVIEDALAESRNEGRIEGRIEGNIEAAAKAIVVVLTSRGLALADEQRALILAERDPAKLDSWLGRAATCADVATLLRD